MKSMDVYRFPIRIVKLLWILGPIQAARIVASRARGDEMISLKIAGLKYPLLCRVKGSDIFCLWQVFGKLSCDVAMSPPPEVIIDAGANVGYASVYYASRYPNATVFAIEPDTTNLAIAAENLKPYPNIHLIRGALWKRNIHLQIDNPDDESWSFRVREIEESTANSLPGYTVGQLLDDHHLDHVDLVKVDIEGAETEVFGEGPIEWIDRCRTVVIEVHGSEAEAAVAGRLSQTQFALHQQGEKLIYTRKSAS